MHSTIKPISARPAPRAGASGRRARRSPGLAHFAALLALVLAACGGPIPTGGLEGTTDVERDERALDERPPGEREARERASASDRLRYAPPTLVDPIHISIDADDGLSPIEMELDRDYVIVMPEAPVMRGLELVGGRNVVLIGGEIFIPHQGDDPSIEGRRALLIADATGVVHVEGVLMHGDDISEGIQTNAPDAIVQLQNVGVYGVRARDQLAFTDNHPDVVQTWGNVGELRVDRLTGESDYQGLTFKTDVEGPHGRVHLSRVNVRGLPNARYLFWTSDGHGGYPEITLDDVWVAAAPERHGGFAKSLWPDVEGAHPDRLVIGSDGDAVELGSWPDAVRVTGAVRSGTPPSGDFVTPESIGVGYVSPGYTTPVDGSPEPEEGP